jgi:calcium/calmodulin-dependent protein kinase (CaM kinase) II
MNQSPDSVTEELLALSQQLLDAIDAGDWSAYAALCDASLTAFEPEAAGHLVRGMTFHRFYFDPKKKGARPGRQSTMSGPEVRLLGEAAVVTYVRLTQRLLEDGGTTTIANEETRVWHWQEGRWQHVHFHRSRAGEGR